MTFGVPRTCSASGANVCPLQRTTMDDTNAAHDKSEAESKAWHDKSEAEFKAAHDKSEAAAKVAHDKDKAEHTTRGHTPRTTRPGKARRRD